MGIRIKMYDKEKERNERNKIHEFMIKVITNIKYVLFMGPMYKK